jgi:hypothetical protein
MEPGVDGLLEAAAIECDTQMASGVDTALRRIEQLLGQHQGLTHTRAKHLVQLPHEGQADERAVRKPARHATPLHDDLGDDML